MKRLNAQERKILRRIYVPVLKQGIWRLITNEKLRERYRDLDTVGYIKNKRLEWVGHLVRMGHGRVV
jgi:hypothetical protein